MKKGVKDVLKRFCVKCKEGYPPTLEYFPADKKNKDGLHSYCRKCNRLRYKKYRKDNLERIKKVKKEYRKLNANVLKQYRDRNKEYQQQWRKENWYSILEKARVWRKENRYRVNITTQKRRSKIMSLVCDFTYDNWCDALDYFKDSCAYCGKKTYALQQDHFIPVSKGGGYVKTNILPACGDCNNSKSSLDFEAWYRKQSFFSEQRYKRVCEYVGKDPQECSKEELTGILLSAKSSLKRSLKRL